MKPKVAASARRRVASIRFKVPCALIWKSVCGSRAAQSCDGWAAAWMMSSIRLPCSANSRSSASPSLMSRSSERNSGYCSVRRAVFWAVEESEPKNRARMSFSTPITSHPPSTRCRTESEPTRPPEPVTIASAIGSSPRRRGRGDLQGLGELGGVARDPAVDVLQHLARASPQVPGGELVQPAAVGEVDGDVTRPLHRLAADVQLTTDELATERGRLQQRETAARATADVDRGPRPALRVPQLLVYQLDEILDVEQVPNLLAAVPDVRQGPTEVVGEQPVREHPLVYLPHLPGAGDDAAAIDHRSQAEGGCILADQELGRELGRAVERAGALQRELLGDAFLRGAGQRLVGSELEPRLALAQRQRVERLIGIDAAGGEKDELGMLATRQL